MVPGEVDKVLIQVEDAISSWLYGSMDAKSLVDAELDRI